MSPTDDDLVPELGARPKLQTSRAVLGVLVAILTIAVLLAMWFLLVDRGDSTASGSTPAGLPTPLPLATSRPTAQPDQAVTPTPEPTAEPVSTATPVPEGFEACGDDRAPAPASTYIVDTNTQPLNQRSEPAVASEQVGAFDPGQSNLVFTGECVVNLGDGYVWWKINNGTQDVWIASNFVSPR